MILLAIAAVVQLLGGALVAAVGATDPAFQAAITLPALLVAISLGIGGGALELTLAWAVARGRARAVVPLILMALIFTALAALDLWALLASDESGNVALPALRFGCNLGGAIVLIQHRRATLLSGDRTDRVPGR